MKRILAAITMIAVIAFLLMPSQSMGQIGIGKGLKGGINSANLSGDDAQDTKSLSGFAAGGFLKFGLGPLSIQPEVLYTQKGAKDSDVEDEVVIEQEFKSSYLEIPVLVKISLGGLPGISPNLFAGPAFGFLLSGKVKVSGGPFSGEEDIKDTLTDTDLGAVIGVGLDLGTGPVGFTVEARYTLGMKSIDATPDDQDVKNGVFSIMGGLSF